MHNQFLDIRQQLTRELSHWAQAALRLSELDELASPAAWRGLEHYLNVALRRSLSRTLTRLQQRASVLQSQLAQATQVSQLIELQGQLDAYKKRYLRTETVLDFYTDAINTRTNDTVAALMRACDFIAQSSMQSILEPLGKATPAVLTHIDKGLGAQMLKYGLRLWDGETISPVAAIKIVRHNLYRPTALIHEAGHQVAHMLGWNAELANVLSDQLTGVSPKLAEVWSGWASEITADTFAFVHTGYAAIAGLHDVVSGESRFIFRYAPFDPHPVSYLRVLLGIALCKISYGEGPWDQMERVWRQKHAIADAEPEVRWLIEQSVPQLEKIADCCLHTSLAAFGGHPLSYWIRPTQVGPARLARLVKQAGAALYTSNHWVSTEAIRLLALGGYQIALTPDRVPKLLQQQRSWMLRLGATLQVA